MPVVHDVGYMRLSYVNSERLTLLSLHLPLAGGGLRCRRRVGGNACIRETLSAGAGEVLPASGGRGLLATGPLQREQTLVPNTGRRRECAPLEGGIGHGGQW